MKIKSVAFSRALDNEMTQRKRRTRRIEAERKQAVYLKVPRIKELDNSISAIAFDMGKRIMSSDNPGEIREVADSLIADKQRERSELLAKNGYPADYLDKQYVCDMCHDTGRIANDLCRCVVQLAINTAFEDSGVNPNQCFANFNLDLQKNARERVAMGRIRDAAEAYANSFPNNSRPDLLYLGESGVGKTYLLNCIGGRLLERGYTVLKLNAHKLIQLTLDTLRLDPSERPDFILPDFLIIDDLGTEPMISNITIETLLSIICQRQDLGKATAFATNLELTSADGVTESIQSMYGERFASRLIAPKIVKIQAVHTFNVRLSV